MNRFALKQGLMICSCCKVATTVWVEWCDGEARAICNVCSMRIGNLFVANAKRTPDLRPGIGPDEIGDAFGAKESK